MRNPIKRNKYTDKKSIVDKMCNNLSKGQKKEYWKHLKLENSRDMSSYIPDQTLIDHFKTTLHDENANIHTTNKSDIGVLDYAISNEELHLASKILKNGRSPGLDNVLNEMIKPFVTIYPGILLKLVNNVIDSNSVSTDWLVSLITAIHKKGERVDPNNYWGIYAMSCFGKLFFTILNNRLIKFATERHLLSENQLGFVQGNRTSDPHIIRHNPIQKYCHKNKKKIYGCFVDFSKAFDNVSRDILLSKLQKNGVDGKFFDILKTIYSNDMACIKIGTRYSVTFKPNKGVRQGCVLSPLLFNIFLADLQKDLDSCNDNLKLDGNKELSCLIWADDILILSESENGLQKKLDTLGMYCTNNKLSVNTDKTECMIFNKTGRLMENKFFFKDTMIKNVRKYKYLGFLVTPSGEIRSGLEDLRIRSLKALMKMKSTLGPLFRQNIQNSIHLYHRMIKPILLYVSDFWGCLKLPKDNPIERLQNTFCNLLLGVQKHTSTLAILLELGLVPLTLNAIKASVKNWDRIRNKKSNNVLYESFRNKKSNNVLYESFRNKKSNNVLYESFRNKKSNNVLYESFRNKKSNNVLYESFRNKKSNNVLYESFRNKKSNNVLYESFRNKKSNNVLYESFRNKKSNNVLYESFRNKKSNNVLYESFRNKKSNNVLYESFRNKKSNNVLYESFRNKKSNNVLYESFRNKKSNNVLYESFRNKKSNNVLYESFRNKKSNNVLYESFRNKKSNNVLYESFRNAVKENLPWTSGIKTTLKSNGMLQSFLTSNTDNDVKGNKKQKPIGNLIFQRISDQFHQNAFKTIRGEGSKLKTYCTLKNRIGIETYLTDIQNIKHRCVMTKLRLSNHPLLIETGRHCKIERQLRFCPFYPTMIEDEIHFLVQCTTYKEMRDKLLTKHILANVEITDNHKFHDILRQKELNMTAKFIFDAFEARRVSLEVADIIESMISKVVGLKTQNITGKKNNNNKYPK